MFLALREMRRGPVRFALLTAAVALLMFLVLFQQALQTGLVTAFVGGLRNQSAPVIVYSVEAQRTLQGSVITPDVQAVLSGVDGVAASALLGQGTFTARIDEADPVDVAVLGVDDVTASRPVALTAGRYVDGPNEAVGSSADFNVGDRVRVVAAPGGADVGLEVVGVADDVQLSVTPTLFTDFAAYAAAVNAFNPDAGVVLPSAVVLHPIDGVSPAQLAAAANEASPDVDAVTRQVAADTAPGVAQVRQSFQIIFGLFALVVPLVTGLFFLIVTLQKSRSLTLLRAIGAPAGLLARSLLIQVVAVTAGGLALGTALYSLVAQGEMGGLSLRYDGAAVRLWTATFLVLAVLGALVSLRRVLRIDPNEATSGGGQR